jgi:DNA replication and repair protein RecF
VGRNGQGKTNLVEAMYYTATLNSHRVSSDTPLIRHGSERAIVQNRIVKGERAVTVELEITRGKANRARVNRGSLGPARDVAGILRSVIFAPEDLALVKGDPQTRRQFVDDAMVQLSPRLAGTLSEYSRVIRQRNALLKTLRSTRGARDATTAHTLEVWNDAAARLGAEILLHRLNVVSELQPRIAEVYASVSPQQCATSADYRNQTLANAGLDHAELELTHLTELLRADMERQYSSELERGMSLVGPHRDDVDLGINGLPAKGYASHGESWSLALAMKLATYHLLRESENGEDADPVLILDDVFAELDAARRQQLADLVAPARQVLVTAAVLEDLPPAFLEQQVHVDAGMVSHG